MADAVIDFRCETCGQGYRVKAELAGKKIKCKCGGVMRVPQPAAADDIADLEEIGVDEEPAYRGDPCPSCGASLAPNAVLCVQCGFNVKTGAKVDTAEGKPVGPGAVAHWFLAAKIVNWILIGYAGLSIVGSILIGDFIFGPLFAVLIIATAYNVIKIVGDPPGTSGQRVGGYVCSIIVMGLVGLGLLGVLVLQGGSELLPPEDRAEFEQMMADSGGSLTRYLIEFAVLIVAFTFNIATIWRAGRE